MFTKPSLFLLSLLVLVSLAASSQRCQSNWQQTSQRLQSARAKWAKNAPSPNCYNMTIQKQCFCTPAYQGPHDLQIVNGSIQNTSEYATEMPTVKELFALVYKRCVKNCPRSGAAKCKVRFDPTYGYVTSLYVDESPQIADEEFGYAVNNLTFCG
jgi:hypothetical protein